LESHKAIALKFWLNGFAECMDTESHKKHAHN
jgi:hypothetical protein